MNYNVELRELVYDFIHQISEAIEVTYSMSEKENLTADAYMFFEAQLVKIAKNMGNIRTNFPKHDTPSKGLLN